MSFLDSYRKKMQMPSADEALPGRTAPIPTSATHFVNGRPLKGPWPDGYKQVLFGMGCFWGAERLFWQVPGVYVRRSVMQAALRPTRPMRKLARASPVMRRLCL